jgi:hypothetical protein
MAKVSVKTKDTIYGRAITEVTINATVGDMLVINKALRMMCFDNLVSYGDRATAKTILETIRKGIEGTEA